MRSKAARRCCEAVATNMKRRRRTFRSSMPSASGRAGQSDDHLRSTFGPAAPEIAKLAPEIETKLGPLAPNAALSPCEERLRLFDSIARFLQSLAAAAWTAGLHRRLALGRSGTLSLMHYLLAASCAATGF